MMVYVQLLLLQRVYLCKSLSALYKCNYNPFKFVLFPIFLWHDIFNHFTNVSVHVSVCVCVCGVWYSLSVWYVIISAGLSLSLSLCVVCIVFLKFTASSDLMVTHVIHKLCVTVIIVYALLTPHTYSLSQSSVCTCGSYMPQCFCSS